jgi:exopolysaccharide production protein ExoZ
MIRPVISSIQALRAVAAVTVAIMHISGATTTLSDSNVWRWFNKMTLSVGHSGVDLFFVISGTIMYLISREASTNNLTAFYSFSVHRIFRIYPLYFLTFVFCLFIIFSGVRAPGTANLFQELTLDVSPVEHPVAWTLPYEVRFYLVVAIIILLFRRHLDAALCVWGVIQLGLMMAWTAGLLGFSFFTYVLMTEFSAGLLVGALISRGVAKAPRLILLISAAWLSVSCYFVYFDASLVTPYRHLLYGIPAAMFLYSVVTLENAGSFKPANALVYAGGLTYSIYLWHFPLLTYAVQFFGGYRGGFWFGLLFLLSMIGVTGAVSFLSYHAVEKPTVRLGRALSRRFPTVGLVRVYRPRFARAARRPGRCFLAFNRPEALK